MKKREFVKARVVSVKKLSLSSRVQMYRIFQTYYDGVAWDQFQHDLSEKNDVILLENAGGGICGFSTLQCKQFEINGRKVIGIFSGDTILERQYWGSPALGIKFLSYLWKVKLKNLGKPVYWFLISKGYKTYLLMANNFKFSFPHFKRATPAFEKQLMDRFYSEKFGESYQPQRGVITFNGAPTCKLKNQIAPITDELRKTVPSIGFFEYRNPDWSKGDELACVARMTLDMPARYAFKKLFLDKMRNVRGAAARKKLTGDRRTSTVRLGPEHRRGNYGR